MNRRLAIAAVLVALAAGLAIYFATRGDSSSKKSGDPAATTAQNGSPDRAAPQPTRGKPNRTSAVDPNAGGDQTNTYTLEDGTIVRDHRAAGSAPYVRLNLPRREDSPIKPLVTSQVMAAVRPIVLKCMALVPDTAFSDPKGVVETRASVSIDAAGDLQVLELGPAVSGIDEEASADALECIRKAAGTIHVHTDSQPVPQATLAFAIRPMQYRKHAQ